MSNNVSFMSKHLNQFMSIKRFSFMSKEYGYGEI